MDIGEKIKQRRKELGLTLDEVAEKVGVGKSTVQKWESGRIKNMRRDKIEILAKVLNMSPLDFVSTEQLLDIAEKHINQEQLVIEDVKHFFGKEIAEIVKRSTLLNKSGIIKLLERMDELIETPKYSNLDLCKKIQEELSTINKQIIQNEQLEVSAKVEPPQIVQTKKPPPQVEEHEPMLKYARTDDLTSAQPRKLTKEQWEELENGEDVDLN